VIIDVRELRQHPTHDARVLRRRLRWRTLRTCTRMQHWQLTTGFI